MTDKNPQHNFKQQSKSMFKASIIFFIAVSILAVCYEVFKEDINPYLDKYLPGMVDFLDMGKLSHQQMMEKTPQTLGK